MEPGLLRQAMAHRSFCSESAGQESNERLELLGDSVLGLVVTEYLYSRFPELPEGDLARMRAAVVSTPALAPLADRLGIGKELLLGRGEEASGGRTKASILADALEALIGAVYLSGGYEAASALVLDLLEGHIADTAAEARLGDPKNQLQEMAARLGLEAPSYEISERGPDHAKVFTAEAVVGGEHLSSGVGRSKKEAERHAAVGALARLGGAEAGPSGRTG